MRLHTLTLALAAALSLPTLANAPLPLDTVVIVDGKVKVDAGDIEGFMQRVPVERRAEARASVDNVATMADAVFVARSFATKARDLGIDKDPVVQRRLAQAEEAVLADLYLMHVEKGAAVPNLEQRARELYNADPEKFTSPEQVHVQHILVGPQWRTKEMAKERAQKIYEEAKAGEDFLSLAARYSDDPDKTRNGGDLGYNLPTRFVEPVRKQIDAMTKKGEISVPIESSQGFHIVKFIDRRKPQLAKFEDVRRSLMQAERDRLVKRAREEALISLRSSTTVVVHRDKVQAMVVPVDDVLKRAAAEAAAAAAAAGKK